MAVTIKQISFDDYLQIPETNQRYEIIRGELHMAPSPTVLHQKLVHRVASLLDEFVSDVNIGVVLLAPLDVIIETAPMMQIRQPDVLYLSNERIGAAGCTQAQLDGLSRLHIAPDMVVEVLSPSELRQEMKEKLEDYHKIGVRECWLVSPEAQTVEVVDLSGARITTTSTVGRDGILHSKTLTGFSLAVAEIFR